LFHVSTSVGDFLLKCDYFTFAGGAVNVQLWCRCELSGYLLTLTFCYCWCRDHSRVSRKAQVMYRLLSPLIKSVRLVMVMVIISGIAVAQFETRASYPTLDSPIGIGVGDFNGDGFLDFAVAAVTNNSEVSVFLGKGYGTFLSPTNYRVGSGPTSMVTGDFNGDGKLDLAIANNGSDSVSVFLGNGDGTFQSSINYNLSEPPSLVLMADFNGDHIPDLAVMSQNTCNCLSILLGNGDGTFQAPTNQPIIYNGT
jgi:hypothetical protein